MSLMSGKEMRFQVPHKRSDSTAGSRNESGSEFQTVGPSIEKLLFADGVILDKVITGNRWRYVVFVHTVAEITSEHL